VRILKSLEEKTTRAEPRGAETPHLYGREKESRRRERPGEGARDWLVCDESMR
jgi:hypothetical protein